MRYDVLKINKRYDVLKINKNDCISRPLLFNNITFVLLYYIKTTVDVVLVNKNEAINVYFLSLKYKYELD